MRVRHLHVIVALQHTEVSQLVSRKRTVIRHISPRRRENVILLRP